MTIPTAIRNATLTSVVVLSACSGGDTTAAPSLTSVTLSPPSATITVGHQTSLTATARDAAARPLTGMTVKWTSIATTVATVDALGTVTGLRAGSALVTASVDGISGSAAITVIAPTYDGLWTGTTAQGDTLTFTVSGSSVLNPSFMFRLSGDCGIAGTTLHVIGSSGAVSGQHLTIMSGGTDLTVSGTFSSFDDASGIGSYTLRGSAPVCTSTGTTTWTAHKPQWRRARGSAAQAVRYPGELL